MAWDVAGQNYLLNRKGYSVRYAFLVFALEQGTLAPATLGLWSGNQNKQMSLDGTSRTYLGGLGKFVVDDFVYAKGLQIQTQTLQISAVSNAVQDLVRGRVIEFVDAHVYAILMDPASALVVSWNRMFRGIVNSANISYPPMDGVPMAYFELASSLRKLSRTLAVKKSDESQRRISDDRFRRYGSISDTVKTSWVKD